MLKLTPPTISSAVAFGACVSGLASIAERRRFGAIASVVEGYSQVYTEKASEARLFEIGKMRGVGEIVGEELVALYEEQMAARKGAARGLYDAIKLSTYRCPLCGHQKVATLDHYLPKKHFPAFAVNPFNLIPACRDCNTHKSTSFAEIYDEQALHPYFDSFSSERWLHARVEQCGPPLIQFFVDPPASWASARPRLEWHLEKFKLHELYGANAAEELVNISQRLRELYSCGSSGAVRNHLHEEAYSRCGANKNSWQTAMYFAMRDSAWFCGIGCCLV